MVTREQYEKSLKRAHDAHLEITLLEATMAHVHNPKNGEGYYTVRFPFGCHAMTCNCAAGDAGTYCYHRALVHEALLARKAQVTVTVEAHDAISALRELDDSIRAHNATHGRGCGWWRD